MDDTIIYSAQKRGFLPGRRYANPRYFVNPASGVSTVIVVGGWSNISEAYQYSNPSITVVEVPDPGALEEYLAKRDAEGKIVEGPKGTATLGDRGAPPAARALPATAADPAKPEPAREAAASPPEPREESAGVPIPDDWREFIWPRLKSLAAKVTDIPIRNRDDAVRAVEQELKRRAPKETRP